MTPDQATSGGLTLPTIIAGINTATSAEVANLQAQVANLGAAGEAPTSPAAPSVPTCQLWQLQSVLTAAQWTAVQAAIAALNNPAVSSFFAHGTNQIPVNSSTLISLGATIGLNAAQVASLVSTAAAVSIP